MARNERVTGLEMMREQLWDEFRPEYLEASMALGIKREGTVEQTATLAFNALRARLSYVTDRQNGAGDGERMGRPCAILANGGDCDDFVSLLGGIVRILHPEAAVASVYWPTIRKPSHVWLRVGSTDFDLTRPTWSGPSAASPGEALRWL